MKKGSLTVIIMFFVSVGMALPVFGGVKDKNFIKGELLYISACSNKKNTAWIYRMTVKEVNINGLAKGTSEMAEITDKNFKKLSFYNPLIDRDISDICKSGCYTSEEEAVADVKKWMIDGCPFDK
ncbi:MAG: hypothetical protein HQK65_06520 [Desulfamplus sp.]|nr:hypothetical protein [Desulfamplus sp.]